MIEAWSMLCREGVIREFFFFLSLWKRLKGRLHTVFNVWKMFLTVSRWEQKEMGLPCYWGIGVIHRKSLAARKMQLRITGCGRWGCGKLAPDSSIHLMMMSIVVMRK